MTLEQEIKELEAKLEAKVKELNKKTEKRPRFGTFSIKGCPNTKS